MKLKAPSLSPGNRVALERTMKWLTNLVTDLETRKAQLDKLDSALQEAELRKNQSEKDAALNPEAALALAGAEAQLSRLAPQVKQLRLSVEGQTEVALRQANTVRSNDLRELLFGPVIEQLQTIMTTAISPFFDADWAKHYARQIMQSSNPYRQIMFYLNRPPVVTTELDAAKLEINAVVGEIENILAGGTLLEV
jgi:hypothetical protein